MTTNSQSDWIDAKHRKSVLWIVALAAFSLFFDGYDIVVYGAILPALMADPAQLGAISAQRAGAIGAYTLVGVAIGALLAGALGDRIGRRKTMLASIVLFSLGMLVTGFTQSVEMFSTIRLITGLGMGAIVVTVGALVAEIAPTGKKNLYNAVVYSGYALGGVTASLFAIAFRDSIGWRGLFWIGALPLVTLVPLALIKLPESPRWLIAHGDAQRAQAVATKTGMPCPSIDEIAAEKASLEKVGFAALVTRRYAWGTVLLGFVTFNVMLLIFGLNTWLPKIMQNVGFGANQSLAFLLVLNGGALFGGLLASRLADRYGPKRVIAILFGCAAVSLVILTTGLPLPFLLLSVAIAGAGTMGTNMIIYGFAANYYMTSARAAGVAWCAGFGRLGGILGPIVGGLIIGAGLSNNVAFYIFAGVAVGGLALTMLIPQVGSSSVSRHVQPTPEPVQQRDVVSQTPQP